MNAHTNTIETRAAEAAARIQKGSHWTDWMLIADGLASGRDLAMHEAGTSTPYGRRYTSAFGQWLEARPWTQPIDKAIRSILIWCHDNRDAIEAWRASLTDEKRDTLNHPRIVKKHFETAQAAKESGEPTESTAKSERGPSAKDRLIESLKARIAELEDEVQRLTHRLNGAKPTAITPKPQPADVLMAQAKRMAALRREQEREEEARLRAKPVPVYHIGALPPPKPRVSAAEKAKRKADALKAKAKEAAAAAKAAAKPKKKKPGARNAPATTQTEGSTP